MTDVASKPKKAAKAVSGDALEDDFYVEEKIEDGSDEAQSSGDDEEQATTGSKRKATTTTTESKSKKKKIKKKKKTLASDPFSDLFHVFKADIATQYAYVQDRQRKALPDLSSVELEEQTLPESQFVDNAKFKHPEHPLESLPDYVKYGVMKHKQLATKPEVLASPTVLVLTHAAMRAADLCRPLRQCSPGTKVAKLFAKHFKIEQQVQFLQHEPFHIGVGTPNRIKTLVEQGHLKLDHLQLVVVDSERNPKRFTIFENDAVRSDLYIFLGTYIAPRMQKGQTKLGLF